MNKRLKASITGIIMASITLGVIAMKPNVPDNIVSAAIDAYKYIVLCALGGYQVAQTFTDHKKINRDK